MHMNGFANLFDGVWALLKIFDDFPIVVTQLRQGAKADSMGAGICGKVQTDSSFKK